MRLISLPLSEAFFLPASEKSGVREPSELNQDFCSCISLITFLLRLEKKPPKPQSNVIMVLKLALYTYLCLKMDFPHLF